MVIICTLGNPCSIFQEDPVVYYTTKSKCTMIAQTKEALLAGSFMSMGYTISSSAAKCDDFPGA